MKILIVTPIPPQPQPTNAVPLVAYGLLTELQARHSVTLVTVAEQDPAEWAALTALQARGIEVHAVRRTEPQGLARWQRRWRFASSWLAGRYPWRTIWFWEAGVQRLIDHLLLPGRFDLLLVDDNAAGVYRYPTHTPTLFIEHEVRRPRPIDWQGWQQNGWGWWLLRELDWQRWLRYQRAVWRAFPRIQVFTQRDAEAVQNMAPELADRVCINPFGVILPTPTDPADEETNSLVFVGGFSHHPNVDAALWLGQEIMPLLRQRVPGLQLWLVGSHPPPEVQALACADIKVTGRVPVVEPYLERATVVVAPIRIGGGMRMKVLQALALGKAVVTTSRGAEGLLTTAQQPPLLIADESKTIADAITRLLLSPALRRELGAQAHGFVSEHYSAAAYARRIESIGADLQTK